VAWYGGMLRSTVERIGTPGGFSWSPDVDGLGVQHVLEMRGMVLLNHLDAGAAVLGDLVDVRRLQ
jgi:hypothetical protein